MTLAALSLLAAQAGGSAPVEALLYTTQSSTWTHRPQLAMDGDPKTTFASRFAMEEMDDFTVVLSRPVAVRSIRIETGDEAGDDTLANAVLETSTDGKTFGNATDFKETGVADAQLGDKMVMVFRIRPKARQAGSKLVIREIKVDSATPIAHVQRGPGRPFADLSKAPDLAAWNARAERQMESFWGETEALLYSDDFVAPNKINIVYRTGTGVTGVAATGGGQMEVNSAYARKYPNDTGLTVHEVAHAIQAGTSPGWLTEAVADYIRWIKYEPGNFTYKIDPSQDVRQPYRAGAVFLAWCELHYDRKLVTKLNDDARFGRYNDNLFLKYTGKDVQTLGKEFLTAYKADPKNIIAPPVSASMRPRTLPVVAAGTSVSADLSKLFDVVGATADGASFPGDGGFDGGGAAYSGTLLGAAKASNGVTFRLGLPGLPDAVAAKGQTIALPAGKHGSLWLFAAAIEGGQRDQEMTVTYADGTTAKLLQNFSDWYGPEGFPGESRAVRMAYRNLANGSRDPRPFYVYSYGFPLDATKTVKSVTLPKNEYVRVLAVSVGD